MNIKLINGGFTPKTDGLNTYLSEIRKYPLLSPDEEIDLIYKIKEGDNEAREKLINCNQRFVFAIAKRYASDDSIMDLVNEGNIGLITAIEKYDDTKGVRFLSYAVWYIRRAINYYMTNDNLLIKRTNNMKIGTKLNKIKNKFYCENGRYPSDDEIIDFMKNDFNVEIQNESEVFDISSESINDFLDDEENTKEKTKAYNQRTASYNDYEETIDKEHNKAVIKKLLSILNERDRTIMKMAFGIDYDKEYTNYEIGEQLGFSSERIRQIISKTKKRLFNVVSTIKA